MTTCKEILQRYGSVAEAARSIGVSNNTAAGWARREMIPLAYWSALLRVAGNRKIRLTLNELYDASNIAASAVRETT